MPYIDSLLPIYACNYVLNMIMPQQHVIRNTLAIAIATKFRRYYKSTIQNGISTSKKQL